jgi:hypothetical protein
MAETFVCSQDHSAPIAALDQERKEIFVMIERPHPPITLNADKQSSAFLKGKI